MLRERECGGRQRVEGMETETGREPEKERKSDRERERETDVLLTKRTSTRR